MVAGIHIQIANQLDMKSIPTKDKCYLSLKYDIHETKSSCNSFQDRKILEFSYQFDKCFIRKIIKIHVKTHFILTKVDTRS